MKPEYILSLSDPQATLENVGGKGMSLAKLLRAGLPVPDGFHVTTEAYRRFITSNDLQSKILSALNVADIATPSSLEAASQSIHELFEYNHIPAEVSNAILDAYQALEDHHAVVAVRSSATAEDLPEASFAGQQETYLNIHGADEILHAVRNCWASLWTARAIAYRIQNKIDQNTVALAVVVQKLVYADAAGIMFTANPINGKRDETIINAAWGLGEAIVGGAVTPDTVTVSKTKGKVIQRETNDKQVMTVRTEQGTQEQAVPDSLRRKPVLNDVQAIELARLGIKIEELYGIPMDIEWTLAAGKFAIVQARPITSLPEAPLEWTAPATEAIVLARGSFAEFVPDPVSPLFATLAVPIALDATQKMMSEFVGIKDNDSYLFEVINGYVYVGIKSKYMLKMLFATITLMKKLMKSSKERWVVVRTRSRETTDKWQRVELSRLSAPELLAGVREIFGITAEYYTVAQSGPIPAASMSELSFSRFYDALVKRKDDPASTTFLLGIENLPLRAEKSLYDLAMWASGQAELANYIKQTPAESICVALQSDAIPSPLSGGFSDRFSAHLAEFGHTLYDLDFAKSTPADDPLPLVEAVKVYIEGKGGNPHERQQNQIERREQAEKAITKRLDSLRRKWFLKFLNQAKDAAPDREDCIADMGLGYPQLRRLARELGRRLTEGGALAKPEDIYWLEAQEVDSLATAMEKGAFLPDHAALVESRKSFWHRARSITPPVTLPEKSWMSKLMVHDNPEGDTLKGYGASAGKVTAPACVMRGPEDFNLMHPGDVIVAVTTTPAWTPLFAMASAVVTDIGGPLSHSSIVAREYGIPAVMATGVCTRRIHSGQIITVDGSTGTVTLAQRNGHPPANDSEIKGASGEGAAGPIEWRPPDPKDVYMRTSVVDLMPDPLSPLFTTWAIPTLRGKMKPLCIRLGMGVPALQEDFYTSINSYAYMNATYPAKTWWWILTRMLPAYPSLLRRMVPIWRDELHPEYQAAVAKYQEKSPEKMSAGELWRDAGAILDSAMYYACGLLFATMGASAGSEGLLTRVYNKVAKQAGDPEANTLLMGWDNIPVRADKSLFDLAMWCREHVELARYMLATTSDRLTEQLKNRQPPASVGASDWQELRERFDAHRQTFGHIIFQLDFAESLPLDNPAPMLENIKMYLRGEGVNPYERQKASEEKRTQTAENIRHRLKGLKRWAFVKALTWGQSLAAVREDALAEIGLGYPILRAMLRELGSRLVHAGAIQQADDIFWLMKDEVEACAYALEGGAELENLSMHVEQRKAFNKKARQETPPPMMPMKKKYMGINTSVWLAESESNRNGNILKGVATSAGKVTAPACVLRGPEDFDQMKPGDVLVTGTTTPAWTPLFAMASAVVTNIGGPLSHGSIVAREYGIPAVMGTGVATKRIQNGQIITVDGSAGMVLLEAA